MWTVSRVASQSENGSDGHSVEIELDVIDEAPAPILSRLERFHNGMPGGVEMFGRVFILRRIAATHVAANHTQPQMNPRVVHLQTLLAAVRARLHIFDLVEMSTGHDSASHDWNTLRYTSRRRSPHAHVAGHHTGCRVSFRA